MNIVLFYKYCYKALKEQEKVAKCPVKLFKKLIILFQ